MKKVSGVRLFTRRDLVSIFHAAFDRFVGGVPVPYFQFQGLALPVPLATFPHALASSVGESHRRGRGLQYCSATDDVRLGQVQESYLYSFAYVCFHLLNVVEDRLRDLIRCGSVKPRELGPLFCLLVVNEQHVKGYYEPGRDEFHVTWLCLMLHHAGSLMYGASPDGKPSVGLGTALDQAIDFTFKHQRTLLNPSARADLKDDLLALRAGGPPEVVRRLKSELVEWREVHAANELNRMIPNEANAWSRLEKPIYSACEYSLAAPLADVTPKDLVSFYLRAKGYARANLCDERWGIRYAMVSRAVEEVFGAAAAALPSALCIADLGCAYFDQHEAEQAEKAEGAQGDARAAQQVYPVIAD